ncbi:MAG TPA: THUMP domain-containing protein [Candidatus Deferrimicrobiaceae bacterium]|jgi:putative N6-adenine-specific DNA methylase|nr:THUMP domain-containing protein [Candidatus Deferrimicrobiaceae bacterium]
MGAHRYFATTSKGLETVLSEEIRALGGETIAVATGGVSFSGDTGLGYRANLWLRTAHRVLLFLSEFPAATPEELYQGVKAVPWPEIFPVGKTIAVDATVRDSGITHSRYAAQKAKDAVADRFREKLGNRPDVDVHAPDVRINVRIVRDACTLSLDLSGESLNRRGYRGDPEEASLRETLAAGMVLLTGWDCRSPLVDPTCGAGTIPIEAALIATNTAPGLIGRTYGFQHLSEYDRAPWEALQDEARRKVLRSGIPRIEGSDLSGTAVRNARKNARRAGVSEIVAFHEKGIRGFAPEGPPGIILCNPPYGVRMRKGAEAEPFYRALGEAFKKRCKGWTAYILSGNPDVTRHIGLKASRRFPLMNGPIDCRLLKYELY